jgi:hypothetical protein
MDSANSHTAALQVSAVQQNPVNTRAIPAVSAQAPTWDCADAMDASSRRSSTSVTGRPNSSAASSGTINAAVNAQIRAAIRARAHGHVAAGIKVAGRLRRHQKRGHQQRPHRDRRSAFGQHPHGWQRGRVNSPGSGNPKPVSPLPPSKTSSPVPTAILRSTPTATSTPNRVRASPVRRRPASTLTLTTLSASTRYHAGPPPDAFSGVIWRSLPPLSPLNTSTS